MVTSRKSIGASIAMLMFFALGAPAEARAPGGAFTLSGMTNAALWASGTASTVTGHDDRGRSARVRSRSAVRSVVPPGGTRVRVASSAGTP